MKTVLVPVKGGYLDTIQGYWIYEVDTSLLIPVRTNIGIHTLYNCDTLVQLIEKVSVANNRVRHIYHANDWPALFDALAYESDKYAWDGRNPEVEISLNEEAIPEAVVWLNGH